MFAQKRLIGRVVAIWVGLVLASAGAYAANEIADKAAPTLCKVMATDSIQFRSTAGPWLSLKAGDQVAVLPLEVRAQISSCRIQVGSTAIIEAQAGSVFTLSNKNGLTLSIKEGAALYALADGVSFVAKSTDGAFSVKVQSDSKAAGDVFKAAPNMGIVKAAPGSDTPYEAVALRGTAQVTRDGQSQTLAQGQAIAVSMTTMNTGASTAVRSEADNTNTIARETAILDTTAAKSSAARSWKIDSVAMDSLFSGSPIDTSDEGLGVFLRPPARCVWTPPVR